MGMPATVLLPGQVFDRLTVIEAAGFSDYPRAKLWRCVCTCGRERVIKSASLTDPGRMSASCLTCQTDCRAESRVIHGDCRKSGPKRTYRIWMGMRRRCEVTTDRLYRWYGGKGVRICEAWLDYPTFLAWAVSHGYTETLTIERKDSNGNYCPENCEWITRQENARRAQLGRKKKLVLS